MLNRIHLVCKIHFMGRWLHQLRAMKINTRIKKARILIRSITDNQIHIEIN